jgi:hypothetical protein
LIHRHQYPLQVLLFFPSDDEHLGSGFISDGLPHTLGHYWLRQRALVELLVVA